MAARARLVRTIDALEYKADIPARLADGLSATAAGIVTRVLGRSPSAPPNDPDADA